VSKKSARRSEKTKREAVIRPSFSNEPSRLNWPRMPRSGVWVIEPGRLGTVSAHVSGLVRPPLSS
jgi:hypothetical protein